LQKFQKYITYKKDYNELLFYLLQNLVRETCIYIQTKTGEDAPREVEISLEDFESRAKEMDITDISSFYRSPLFTTNNFFLDRRRKVIKKVFS
jgi:DNA replication licensing factor MCM2